MITGSNPLAEGTIEWASEAAYRLTKDGKVGFGAVLRSISTNEIRRWFIDTQPDPAEIEKLIHAIRWALGFPSVFALSEGCNPSRLSDDLGRTCVSWIESMSEHFEANEYRLVAGLAELAVADAILERSHNPSESAAPMTVLHPFPAATEDGKLPPWVAERDIPVILTPSAGQPIAVLNPLHSNRSYLRGQQVLRRDDADMVRTGLAMLSAKVANQAAVLRYFGKYRKKTDDTLARELTKAADELRRLSEQLKGLDLETAEVRTAAMGLEGHSAAIYWRCIAKLASTDLEFHRRSGRSARDPVNQCINYIYGILYGEVWRCVVKAGLDPYFGLMHGSQRDQGSLVFDIIEEFRAPFADRLIFGMLGRRLRPEVNRDGFLRTRTKRKLAKAFAKSWSQKIHWRSAQLDPAHILEQQCRDLAKLVLRKAEYHPFHMRW